MYLKRIILLLFSLLLLNALHGRDLEEIKRSGKIMVAFTSDDIRNINYPLAVEFARYLNVELVEVIIDWEEVFMHNGAIPDNLESDPNLIFTPDALKKADIICSTFTVLDWRKKLFDFGETLYSTELLLISKAIEAPRNFSDLIGKKITYRTETTFEEHLKEINKKIGGGMRLVPTETGNEGKKLFLNGDVYGIVLDADEALNFNALNNHKFQIAFPISEVTKTAWAVEKGNPLKQEVENFFETISSNGILDDIFNEKFGIRYSTFVENIQKNHRYEKLIRDLDGIQSSKKLVVALRDRNFIYRSNGQKQFMHALAEEFADHLGVSLEIVITPYFGKYWETSEGVLVRDSSYTPDWFNYFDIACEVFAPLDWRTNKVDLIPIYPSEFSVIAKKETKINTIDDLKKLKCITGENTVYEDILIENKINNYYIGNKVNNYLPAVDSGKADYTILYNAFFELSQFPDLEVKLKLGDLNVCWGIRKDQPLLKAELDKFIKSSSENGLIKVLMKSLKGNTLQNPDAYINSYYESFQTGQLPYVNYGADDGLPQEDVFSIFQDMKGYIWFGTNSGAVRYNGREMYVYNESHGLPSNTVRDIKQDEYGAMLLATNNGVAVLNRDTVTKSYFPGTAFKKILVDRKNNKWLIGDNGVYFLSNKYKETSLNSRFPELPRLVYNITEDTKSGSIYLATSIGLFLIDLEENSTLRINDKDCFSVFVDLNDSIWISTKSGLYISDLDGLIDGSYEKDNFNLNQRLDFPTEIFTEIKTNSFGSVWLISDSKIYQVISTDQKPISYQDEIGIRNNKILSFFADKEDNIWIGFSGGLKRLKNSKGLRNFYPNTLNSYIYSIFEDKNNRIWLSSNNGIYYFKDEFIHYTPPIGVENQMYLTTPLKNGNILLANTFGVYEINVNTLKLARFSQFPQLPVSIENVFVSSKGEIFLLTGINGTIYYLADFYSLPVQLKNRYTSNIFQLTEYDGKVIGGNNSGIVAFDGKEFTSILQTDCNVWSLYANDTTLWAGTDCGLGRINNGRFEQLSMSTFDQGVVIKTIIAAKNKNYLWIGTNRGFSYYNVNTQETEFNIDTKDGLSGDEITSEGLFLDKNDLLWIGTYHGISNFNIRAKSFRSYAPVCYIENLKLNGKNIDPVSGKSFRHNENNFVFEISALSFTDEKSVEYEFYLRGAGNNYSSYHKGSEFRAYYNNLPPGNYDFIYKAKGKNNLWGYAESYSFSIKKAWYSTWIFRISLTVFLLLLAYLFYKANSKLIKKNKRLLEQEINTKNKDLEDAHSKIETQREHTASQRELISLQQKNISDSIRFAHRIQESMLPSNEIFEKIFPEHFVLFKPRDTVSGDFYWAAEQEDCVYFTAADCTGHDVQGAFMSILGIGFLNEIINSTDNPEPDEIMNLLHNHLKQVLPATGKSDDNVYGMDMVICKYNKSNGKISYSSANNPLYHVSNGKLQRYKGEKIPLAIQNKQSPFKLSYLDIQPGDRIYLFSDGYFNQFGGPDAKKLMPGQFRKLLIESSSLSMNDQYALLNNEFEKWKGKQDQIDDVLVIGVKF